jgi:hypothetical protein
MINLNWQAFSSLDHGKDLFFTESSEAITAINPRLMVFTQLQKSNKNEDYEQAIRMMIQSKSLVSMKPKTELLFAQGTEFHLENSSKLTRHTLQIPRNLNKDCRKCWLIVSAVTDSYGHGDALLSINVVTPSDALKIGDENQSTVLKYFEPSHGNTGKLLLSFSIDNLQTSTESTLEFVFKKSLWIISSKVRVIMNVEIHGG